VNLHFEDDEEEDEAHPFPSALPALTFEWDDEGEGHDEEEDEAHQLQSLLLLTTNNQ
jgi:hypothetical protein